MWKTKVKFIKINQMAWNRVFLGKYHLIMKENELLKRCLSHHYKKQPKTEITTILLLLRFMFHVKHK